MKPPLRVDVLVFEGCPHAEPALALVREVVGRLAPDATVDRVEVETPEKAAEFGFSGSPSIRVNSRDIEGRQTPARGLACRTYDGQGVPPEWLVEVAILRELNLQGILFLCVANSARSQIAEGIARSLLPASVKVWSAGSRPTSVRPEAIAVLREVGIDISTHRSKDVSEIPADEVDTVITLCGEEECPLFLGKARRLRWGLPDPAAIGGSEEERLAAFRKTRDELRGRIAALLVAGERHWK
jgi:arsenate reductase (thioredoxin)